MKIKVCGITSIDEALALSKAGVNYVGFIFYPASKRYALHALTLDQIKSVQLPGVLKVGVFVNEPMDEVISTADAAGLDMVQLHGDETPNYCKEMANQYPVIKAFRISETDDVAYKIAEYLEEVDYLALDDDYNPELLLKRYKNSLNYIDKLVGEVLLDLEKNNLLEMHQDSR